MLGPLFAVFRPVAALLTGFFGGGQLGEAFVVDEAGMVGTRQMARIINEVDGISRVTYDISGKPPATIEWE